MKGTARKKVLFVCLGNACRSPMAETIANKLAGDVMEASSAGLTPLGRVEALTLETLLRNGYPPNGLESKALLDQAFHAADLVVNMSGRAKEREFAGFAKVENWFVEDPYGADAKLYQRIFEDIEKRVAELADRIRKSRHSVAKARNNVRSGIRKL
ncbi:MAG TPA: low molecular weight phosphatase family protein [Candidatus Solibacter sp.]|nr:low molecular weight phosphatase family protein [Candidatus Solibacter sp.]